MHLSLSDKSHFASRGMLGVYFSNTKPLPAFPGNSNLPHTPQVIVSPNNYVSDKNNWVQYDMQYKAQGGEEHITIGNFHDTTYLDTMHVPGGGNQFWMLNTYYFIDDVWLSHCDSVPRLRSSINEQSIQDLIKLYPNPSSGIVNIKSEKIIISIEVYDMQGKLQNEFIRPEVQFELPEQNGLYLIKVFLQGGDMVMKKVVRE